MRPTLKDRIRAEMVRRPQTPTTGLGAIIGQWPGDETDEEIAEGLRGLDPESPQSSGGDAL